MNQLTSQTGAADSASNDHRTSEELNSHRRMQHWTFVEGTPAEVAKHTPGPWSVFPASAKNTGTLRRDIASLGCEFSPSFVAGDVLEDDAHLIAAAPDLLAALKGLMEEAQKLGEKLERMEPNRVTGTAPIFAFISDAANAIAKAGGVK